MNNIELISVRSFVIEQLGIDSYLNDSVPVALDDLKSFLEDRNNIYVLTKENMNIIIPLLNCWNI